MRWGDVLWIGISAVSVVACERDSRPLPHPMELLRSCYYQLREAREQLGGICCDAECVEYQQAPQEEPTR